MFLNATEKMRSSYIKEGSMRCLLITILVSAATATFEYNNQDLRTIHEGIRKLDKMKPVDIKNMDAAVEWIRKRSLTGEIEFEIKDRNRSSGENCGEGPKLIIYNGPDHCLYGMNFLAFSVDEDSFLQLAIFFRNSQNDSDKRIMISELFKKPEHPAQDLSNVVHVEPIPRQQLAKARNMESFVAPISWLGNLLEKGIFAGKGDSNSEESVGDTDDTDVAMMYTTYPVVMDEDILNQILEMGSLP